MFGRARNQRQDARHAPTLAAMLKSPCVVFRGSADEIRLCHLCGRLVSLHRNTKTGSRYESTELSYRLRHREDQLLP